MTLSAVEFLFLAYLTLLNFWSAVGLYATVQELRRTVRRNQSLRFESLLNAGAHQPISVLVPAHDEQETILGSISALLNLRYPQFEIIVISDGSTDRTMQVLHEHFDLRETLPVSAVALQTEPIRAIWRSQRFPQLTVIDKENGGKADALNAGLRYAGYPLFCSIDADSLLDEEALVRAARRFADHEELLAVGGTVRPMNGVTLQGGRVVDMTMPGSTVERFQVMEYVRAFFTGRTALSSFGLLLIVSGAFGLFRRAEVVQAGGYNRETVGEDMELIVRLHRWARDQRRPYAIQYVIDPVCWTQVPDTWQGLRRQRDRWQRGLLESLWLHRRMLFNPRYGRIGMVAMPYHIFFEALAPALELGGLFLAVFLIVTERYDATFVVLFFLLAVGFGTLLSSSSHAIEVFLRHRLGRPRDRLLLLGYALLDNLGYRQWNLLIRLWASLTLVAKRGQWGGQQRRRIDQGAVTGPAQSEADPVRSR